MDKMKMKNGLAVYITGLFMPVYIQATIGGFINFGGSSTTPHCVKLNLSLEDPMGSVSFMLPNGTTSMTGDLNSTSAIVIAPRRGSTWPGMDSFELKTALETVSIVGGMTGRDIYIQVGDTVNIKGTLTSATQIFMLVDYVNEIAVKYECSTSMSFTLGHHFNTLGVYELNINETNFSNGQSADVTLHVVHALNGYSIAGSNQVLEVGEPAVFTVSLSAAPQTPMSPLVLTKTCGESVESINFTLANSETVNVNCNFTAPGYYAATVTIHDAMGFNVSRNLMFSVNPKCNVSAESVYKIGEDPKICLPKYGFTYVINFGEGSDTTSSVGFNGEAITLPSNLNYEPGSYTITITSNSFTTVTQNLQITYEQALVESQLTTNVIDQVLVPPGTVEFQCTVDTSSPTPAYLPTNVTCRFYDPIERFPPVESSPTSVSTTVWATFSQTVTVTGMYTVYLECSNIVSNLNLSTTFHARTFSALDVSFDVPYAIVMNNSIPTSLPLTFNFSYLSAPPPDLMYAIAPITGTPLTSAQMTIVKDTAEFTSRDQNYFQIKLNYYSSENLFQKYIKTGIIEVTKTTTGTQGQRGVTSFNFEIECFLVDQTVVVTITWDDGSADSTLTFTAGAAPTALPVVPTKQSVDHIFQDQKLLKPRLVAVSPVGTELLDSDDDLWIQNVITDIKISIDIQYSYKDSFSPSFTLEGNFFPLYNVSCKYSYPSHDGQYIIYDYLTTSTSFTLTVPPSIPGYKRLTVSCKNDVTPEVTRFDDYKIVCFKSPYLFENLHRTKENAKKMVSDSPQLLTGRQTENCLNVTQFGYHWTIEDETGTSIPIQQPNIYRITLKDHIKTPGVFKLTLNITMPGISDEFIDDFIWVDFVFSPLVAKIAGGTEKLVGKGEPLGLDGSSQSYDPNVGFGVTDPELIFEWKCYAITDEAVLNNFLSPSYNGTEHRNQPACTATISSSGKTTMDTSSLQENTWVLIEMTVKKDHRQSSNIQAVKILRITPPEGNIRCVLNCQSKLVPDDTTKMVVDVNCPTCEDSKLNYTWTVFKYNPSTSQDEQVPWKPEFSSARHEKTFSAIAKAFDEGSIYKLKVEILYTGKPNGLSTLRFSTNYRPYGGTCQISPTTGKSVFDDFHVSCTGWKDEGLRPERGDVADASEPLDYRVTQYIGATGVVVSDGVENITPPFKLQLCPSTNDFVCDIVVVISDSLAFGVNYTLSVKVTSPLAVTVKPAGNETVNAEEAAAAQVNAIEQLTKSSGGDFEGKTPTEQSLVASAIASVINDVPVVVPLVETLNVEAINDTKAASATLINSLKSEDPVTEKLSEALEGVMQKSTASVDSATKNGSLSTSSILKFATSFASSVPNPDIVSEKTQADVSNVAVKLSSILLENTGKTLKQNEIMDALRGISALQDNVVNIGSPNIVGTDQDLPIEEVKDESGFNPLESAYFKAFKDKKKNIAARKRKRAAKENIKKNDKMWDNSFKILQKYTTSDKEVTLDSKTFKLKFQKSTVGGLLKTMKNTTEFKDNIISNVEGIPVSDDAEIQMQTIILKKNIYIQGENSFRVSGPVVKTAMHGANDSIIKPNKIKTAFKDPESTKYVRVIPEFIEGDASRLFYQKTLYRNKNEFLCLLIQPESPAVHYDLFWRSLLPPTDAEYDFKTTEIPRGSDGQTFVTCIKPGTIKRKGVIFLGLRPYVKDDVGGSSRRRRSVNNTTTTTNILATPFNTSFQSFSCLTWNGQAQDWDDDKCEIEKDVVAGVTTCRCQGDAGSVMTTSFFVPPNSIDFSTVFSKFDIVSQAAVLSVIIIVLVIGIILAVWGRWRDSFDVLEWGVTLLEDNFSEDKYYYLITVYTSFVREGSTMSNVSFDIYGENNNTDIRQLSDGVRKGFKAGSVMHFLMAVPEKLGNLQYLRIWHDNSGKDMYASWHLNRVEVIDIQNEESFVFLCNKWLSIEEGIIDRVLPACGAENIRGFKRMFMEHATSQITDEHIWLSVLFRPVKSNFTRVQRVGCCVTLLFLSMISNAMFFQSGDNKDRQRASSIELGPIKFNPSQIYISLVSSILTAIPVYVIMTLFRKSKQNPWERKKKRIPHWLPKFMKEKLEFSQKLEDILVISDNIAIKDAILPTWCVFIGWFLVFVASFLACFFIMLYSMEWGKDLSEEWLTTFFLSFVESIMFVDPFKVLFLAVIAGILLKTLKINRPTKYDLKEITDLTTKHGKIKIERRQASTYQSTNDHDFKHIKAQKLRDNQMKNVIKELILNILFLFLLSCILYSNRDTQSYHLHKYIQDNFLDPPKPYRIYDKVIQSSHYFEWMNNTALPALFPETDYRGIRMTATERRFSYNSPNLKVGPPRLRQVRTRIGNCSYPYIGHITCIPVYEVTGEDTDNYCPAWKPQPCSDAEESLLTIDAWKFTSASSIWGAPIAGLLTLYGGGGYIANLDVNKIVSTESLNEVFKSRWIDRQTRAVFFEFTLYNIDINMFVYVSILTEFPETGGVVTYENIFPFRPSQHEGTLGKFILVCEIFTMVYIAVSVILMAIRFAKQKWMFFSQFWNIVEFIMVSVSLVAMVFYILRIQYTSQALAAFNENDREFVNFYHVVIWDYAFVYVLGILVTIATLRLLKALAYTDITFKVFSVLGQTIKVFPGFATFIAINLLSFSSAGYFLFGRTGAPYKSMITCMETMFVGLMGDATFKTTGAEVALGPMETIYFSLFVIGVTILLTNLFLAILMDVMNRAIEDPPSKQEVDMNVFSYMWQSMTRVFTGKHPDYTYRYKEGNDVTTDNSQQMTHVKEYKNPSKLSLSLSNIKQFETKRPFDQKMSIYEKLSSLNGTIE